jgi:hypothetical protein
MLWRGLIGQVEALNDADAIGQVRRKASTVPVSCRLEKDPTAAGAFHGEGFPKPLILGNIDLSFALAQTFFNYRTIN